MRNLYHGGQRARGPENSLGGLEALREERHRWQLKLERVTASHFEGKDAETQGPKTAEPAKEPDAG